MTEKPHCPHCAHEQVSRWGFANGLQRYRCNACRATFNALTDTPLAGLRHKAKWIDYAKQLAEGTSIRKSAAAVGIHPNTAFRWRHRFLNLPNGQQAISLAGIAEPDETYFLESQKGRRQGLSRAPRKRGGKASKRGLSEEQTAVLICRDRTGNTADFILEKADKAHLGAVLKPLLATESFCAPTEKRRWRLLPKKWASPTGRSIWLLVSVLWRGSIMCRTSMPTIADSRNGYAASTASPPATWVTIWAGDD